MTKDDIRPEHPIIEARQRLSTPLLSLFKNLSNDLRISALMTDRAENGGAGPSVSI